MLSVCFERGMFILRVIRHRQIVPFLIHVYSRIGAPGTNERLFRESSYPP
jgi:hypothetical protein